MPKWKLTLEYDGTRYRGWQEQVNARTIQGELHSAAQGLFGKDVDIAGSGRTDAGVHALRQVAHLQAHRPMAGGLLRQNLNDRLPSDIYIREALEVPARFHARHHAEERFYLYQISTRRTAFGKRFVWWIKDRLNVPLMQKGAQEFVGMHDFAAFHDKREDAASTLVDVTQCELRMDGDLILFRIGASHFLWKMVRRIVGVLVETGRGNLLPADYERLSPEDIARWTAPPSGLFLEYVRYPGEAPPDPITPAISSR
jgi:tRNA pseudouridine38-40 synthase